MEIQIITPYSGATFSEIDRIAKFLYDHLGQYGDDLEDIKKAIGYALKERISHGGFVLTGAIEEKIVGAVVVNKTGMEGYIPENILVYIATHQEHRGEGIGKRLMRKAIALADGDIALHVEADNPAFHLYKKLGFEKKYLEMRLSKEDLEEDASDKHQNAATRN